jgi:hypothetical protein
VNPFFAAFLAPGFRACLAGEGDGKLSMRLSRKYGKQAAFQSVAAKSFPVHNDIFRLKSCA